ncbi:MAG: hypothetical protein VX463_18425, partial [Pseudomonadota bacterium]|nr:hypothetical protein [Pseudomonadota bacterium]
MRSSLLPAFALSLLAAPAFAAPVAGSHLVDFTFQTDVVNESDPSQIGLNTGDMFTATVDFDDLGASFIVEGTELRPLNAITLFKGTSDEVVLTGAGLEVFGWQVLDDDPTEGDSLSIYAIKHINALTPTSEGERADYLQLVFNAYGAPSTFSGDGPESFGAFAALGGTLQFINVEMVSVYQESEENYVFQPDTGYMMTANAVDAAVPLP